MGILSNLTDEYFGDRVREEDFSRKVVLVLKDMDWEKDVINFIEKLEDSNVTELRDMIKDNADSMCLKGQRICMINIRPLKYLT